MIGIHGGRGWLLTASAAMVLGVCVSPGVAHADDCASLPAREAQHNQVAAAHNAHTPREGDPDAQAWLDEAARGNAEIPVLQAEAERCGLPGPQDAAKGRVAAPAPLPGAPGGPRQARMCLLGGRSVKYYSEPARRLSEGFADPEDEVLIHRSAIDSTVWYCVSGQQGDISILTCPGRIRAVKRYVEACLSFGEPIRWVRRDPNTWEMVFVD